MVGPSSSHTAGAVRIGLIARRLLGSQPVRAELLLHGSFAATGAGHGTDKALAAGLLGMQPDDPDIPRSFALARQAGMELSIGSVVLRGAHPNTVVIRAANADGRVLEINASPGTDGISDVIDENFINIILNELKDPNNFYLQEKTAGYVESINIDFGGGVSKNYLAKLDTGNSTSACTLEVGEYEEKDDKISFTIDGKKMTFDSAGKVAVRAGEVVYNRPAIIVPQITIGLRKLNNVKLALVKNRDTKTTNCLVNRDTLARLGYVVDSNKAHRLTPEMEKVKIV